MIEVKPISWFYENLPEEQIVEDRFKEIIRKNYNLSGFVSVETLSAERVETLTSKWWDDNEIYGLHRLKGDNLENVELGLRFDLTVPFARYVAQNEWVLSFPFKRQQIQKVWRGERPQKCRYREFSQADVDIVWNGTLSLFADVEILSTIHNSLKELNFGDFVININNKKLLIGFLENIWVKDIVKTISIIDKKDKVKSIVPFLEEIGEWINQQKKIWELIKVSESVSNKDILSFFAQIENETLQEWLNELHYLFKSLIALGVEEKNLKINPSISRGLNYYTGTVFETFINGFEKYGSIASGGRYENLCSHFSKNNYPGVWGSIWLSRLLCILQDIWNIEYSQKVPTQVLVLNMWEELLQDNLEIVKTLRMNWINTEIYLDANVKIQKQFKYADNKKIPLVIIYGENEKKWGFAQLKNLQSGEQKEVLIEELVETIISK